jgi:hypothetical protein
VHLEEAAHLDKVILVDKDFHLHQLLMLRVAVAEPVIKVVLVMLPELVLEDRVYIHSYQDQTLHMAVVVVAAVLRRLL